MKKKTSVSITIDNGKISTNFNGDSFDIICGLINALELIIRKYPKEVESDIRGEVFEMLQDAKRSDILED